MSERAALIQFWQGMGATPAQAATMADQVLKRCEQLVGQRGWTREQAMQHLLEVVTKGSRGETAPGFEGSAPMRLRPQPDESKPVDGAGTAATVPASPMQAKLIALFHRTFGRAPEIVARAPGRVEFIGNHTDYNGGTVLGAAVDRDVWVALARREDGQRRFYSELTDQVVTQEGAPQPVQGEASWINYPLGVIAAFDVFGLRAPGGFDYVAASDLPTGAGLSSSAAIELASALAFLAATGQRAPRETVVKIGRHAENHFVGMPCGILDQGVSGFGRRDHLVFIDCRGPHFATVPMPPDVHLWIFNTHTKHALVDGLYAARHRECMDAAATLGVALLADASLDQLEAARERLSDAAYRRARHVVEEIARVEATRAALDRGDLAAVGQALTSSHRSSQHLFENSTAELDFLVDRLVATPHVWGARLTGGGFGGAVMALTSSAFTATDGQAIAEAYQKHFGHALGVLHMQTGSGAELVQGL